MCKVPSLRSCAGLENFSSAWILDFIRRQIERSTGASRSALEVEAEKTKVSLVLAPRGSVRRDLFYDLSGQDHKRFEVILVISDDDTMLREDCPRIENLKILRVSREKSRSARIALGFGKASGEILGYLDEESSLLPSGLGIESRLKSTVSAIGRMQELKASTAEQIYAGQLASVAQEFPESPRRVLDFPSRWPWAIPWKRCVPNSTAEVIVADGWQSWRKC